MAGMAGMVGTNGMDGMRRFLHECHQASQPRMPCKTDKTNTGHTDTNQVNPTNNTIGSVGDMTAVEMVVQAIDTHRLHVLASQQVVDSLSKLGKLDTRLVVCNSYGSFYYVDNSADVSNPVWCVVLNSIRAATAIFTDQPGGSDWTSQNTNYSASVTQSATSAKSGWIIVELIVDKQTQQQMYTVWLGLKGQQLVIVICQDYQSCWLFC